MKTKKMWSLFTHDKVKETSLKNLIYRAKIFEMYSDLCYGIIGDF